MLLLLMLLLQWRVTTCTSSPTLEDNMLPTDEEVISDLINSYRGQPEQEIALNLPTDEEAFNEIKPILQSGSPFYYTNSGGHFVSSSFPEIDARGFHESVFDDLDDLYPISRRGKKQDSPLAISARGFYGDIFTDGFGSFHLFKRDNNDESQQSISSENTRQKRSLPESAVTELPKTANSHSPRYDQADSTQGINRRSGRSCHMQTCPDVVVKPVLNDFATHEWKLLNADLVNNSIRHPSSSPHQYTSKQNQTDSIFRHKRNSQPTRFSPLFDSYPKIHSEHLSEEDVNNFLNTLQKQNVKLYKQRDFEETQKRVPDMGQSGFHNDVFHNNFGNFDTLKRAPDMGQSGFHGDVFHKSFGNFNTLKRAPDMGQTGFHGDVFHNSFGNFDPLRKRSPGVDTKNFHGDAFDRDFGKFDPLRKRKRKPEAQRVHFKLDLFDRDLGNYYAGKRRVNAGAVNADAFHSNFGGFDTLKKRRPVDDAFHDGAFTYGNFETVKRRPESAELNGDAFHSNFGNFNTMKRWPQDNLHSESIKRRPSSGELTGDAFHSSFGNFDTMKRTLGGDAFHSQFGKFDTMKRTLAGDAFHSQFGKFDTMKRTLAGDAFHSQFGKFDTMKRTIGGDAFHSQFGKFETMKRAVDKRRPEMDSSGFEGDVFHHHFGNFDTVKRSPTSWFHKDLFPGGDYTDGLDAFKKAAPHRFSRLRYFPVFEPDHEVDYEKFRKFIRNYALTNQFEDLSSRIRSNETATTTSSRSNTSIASH